MSLRRALMLAFVLLGLLPCIALSWLGFTSARRAMESQIAASIDVKAATLQADIDRMLFERFENALVWSRSELMQDLRLGDVDKRVSNYLVGLAAGYSGVYGALDCIGGDRSVIASSLASDIGRREPEAAADAVSIDANLGGAGARLLLPAGPTLDDVSPFVIETAVASRYAAVAGPPLALLRLEFDARQISALLDRAAAHGQLIAIVDAQGRWVAGSRALRGRAMPDASGRATALEFVRTGSAARVRSGAPWTNERVIAGVARSRAAGGFAGSGWSTVVLQPVDEALAPVHRMAWIFAGLLAAVLCAALVAAPMIARSIARPIGALIETTRRFQRDGRAPAPAAPQARIRELAELDRAYTEMIGTLERSRGELVRASKLAMLGELAAVLAHEVRTPLGILRSSAQVLLRDSRLGAESRELMGFIQSETDRLNRLVTTMLDTARPRQPSFAPCDLHALLERCVQMQAVQQREASAQPSAAIAVDAAAADPAIEADAELLMQAVFNLLQNALQAAGPEGHVRLTTADEGGFVRLECADDGPGIAPEVAEHVFDPFFTRRAGGIGLGLAVVQQVIHAHGGQIAVGRGEWGGTSFVMRLPRRQARLEKAA